MPKAKNLKYCRQNAGLTQQEFADAIGASRPTINAWETRKRAIPAPSAKRIAEYFGIEYAAFCDIDLESDAGCCLKLTDEETNLAVMYRKLPDDMKEIISMTIKAAYKKVSE